MDTMMPDGWGEGENVIHTMAHQAAQDAATRNVAQPAPVTTGDVALSARVAKLETMHPADPSLWERAIEKRVEFLEDAREQDEALARATVMQTAGDGGVTHYAFHIRPELVWAVLTAVVTVLAASLANVDAATDWRTWAVGVAAAAVRAGLGALMSATGPADGKAHDAL